ncbi:MAG: hypothetical protein WA821_00555 [Anaerolineales bacterium]
MKTDVKELIEKAKRSQKSAEHDFSGGVRGERMLIKPVPQTLLNLRGSIPVSDEQDFDAVRKQVITKRAKQPNLYNRPL